MSEPTEPVLSIGTSRGPFSRFQPREVGSQVPASGQGAPIMAGYPPPVQRRIAILVIRGMGFCSNEGQWRLLLTNLLLTGAEGKRVGDVQTK